MTTESMPHVGPSEAKSTSEIDTNWMTRETHKDGDSVLLQEDIANTGMTTSSILSGMVLGYHVVGVFNL